MPSRSHKTTPTTPKGGGWERQEERAGAPMGNQSKALLRQNVYTDIIVFRLTQAALGPY